MLYFLTQTYPDIIFTDDTHVSILIAAVLMLQKYKVKINIPKIVIVGKYNLKNKNVEFLESILNNELDANELDKFTCVKLKSTMDVAVEMFSSNTISYPGNAQIPYAAFTSPSNNDTPTMIRNEIGLWFGSLCWTHSLLLTVRCILSRVTAIKHLLFSEGILYRIIQKYKVIKKEHFNFNENETYTYVNKKERKQDRYRVKNSCINTFKNKLLQ